ncbi:MAG: hypothetical protein ISS70_22765 [Phycisphaerae bacterium]|nr:hypothetical protein [Phycisphaerae bacterium]
MKANDYAEQVVHEFRRHITDHVFLSIQHNEKRMREYQTRVNENSLREVNQAIGKKVKEIFCLDDDGVSPAPKSWLIKVYTLYK